MPFGLGLGRGKAQRTSVRPVVAASVGIPSLSTSLATFSPSTIAYGAGTATLTVTLLDANGVQLTGSGGTITLEKNTGTSDGTLSAVTDNSNGTYTATWTPSTAGTARSIIVRLDGNALITIPTITTIPGTIDRTVSTVTFDMRYLGVDSVGTLTLQAKDGAGNSLTTGGSTVAFGHSGGTADVSFAAVSDVGDGTYTCVVTGTVAGTETTFTATIGGSAVTTTMPTITVYTIDLTALEPFTGKLGTTTSNFTTSADYTVDVTYLEAYRQTISPAGTYHQTVTIAADPTGSGRGDVLKIHYQRISSDDRNDALTWAKSGWDLGLGETVYFRGEVYVDPDSDIPNAQRKLLYWKQPDLQSNGSFAVLSAWGEQLSCSSGSTGPFGDQLRTNYEAGTSLTKQAWHTLEMRITMNTDGGVADGIIQVWCDGTLIFDRSDYLFAQADTDVIRKCGIGQQVNDGTPYDEYRYWDNIAFSTTRIGS